MRKSKMLDKIRAVLIDELDYDYIIGLERTILEEIEEAGMLPPYDSSTDDGEFGHKWEPENEKK